MNEPKTFKRISGPFRVDGDAYGAFAAVGVQYLGHEFVVLAKDAAHVAKLFKALGETIDTSKAKRVAIVQAAQLKRAT